MATYNVRVLESVASRPTDVNQPPATVLESFTVEAGTQLDARVAACATLTGEGKTVHKSLELASGDLVIYVLP